MWIEMEGSGSNRDREAPTWRNTLASLASGLAICATFLVALFIAGSP